VKSRRFGLFVACVGLGLVTLPWWSAHPGVQAQRAGLDAARYLSGDSARLVGVTPNAGPTATVIRPRDGVQNPGMASPSSDSWLAQINLYRAMAKLPPIAENLTWSAGCAAHARYMVKNAAPGHSEDVDNPWYTPEGELCAQRGNVFVYSSTEIEDTAPIDGWMQGPFHALGLIDPRLVSVGYGTYRQAIGLWRMGATLNVLQGLEWNLGASTAYPVLWPAEGASSPLSAYTGSENPDPLASCPDFSVPSGLPIVMQLGSSSAAPEVTDHSLWQGDTELDHCVYDETSYTNPDDSAQALGRDVLAMRNAVVLIPRDPLEPGGEYTVSITASGQTYTWSFGVSPSAPFP